MFTLLQLQEFNRWLLSKNVLERSAFSVVVVCILSFINQMRNDDSFTPRWSHESECYGLFLPLPPAAAYDECSPVTVDK